MTIFVIHFTCVIIYFNPILGSSFRLLIWCIWLTNLLFFDISILYYYFYLSRSSIIFCLSPRYTYFSLGITSSCSFVTFSELFCCKVFETLLIPLDFLFLIKSSVSSAIFWFALFELASNTSAVNCLEVFDSSFYYIFTSIINHIFHKRQKSIACYKYLTSWLKWIAHHFYILHFNK